MFVVVFVEDVLGLKAKELTFAYSNYFDLFFVVGLVVYLVEIGRNCTELLFAVLLIGVVFCLVSDFCLSVENQEKLSDDISF